MLFSDTMGAVEDPLSAMELIPKPQLYHPDWLFMYLLVLLGFFAWIRISYGNILIQTVQASTNFQVASRMFQDNSLLQNQLDNILYALYFLSLAFLLFHLENEGKIYPYGQEGGLLYLFNLALLLGMFFGRIIAVNLAGFLFNQIKLFREYLYNAFIFNKLLGMAVLPPLLFVVYTTGILQKVILSLTLTIIALVVVMRIIRGLVFSFKKEISLFYMFLYLCALEIVPLALLYRWLDGIL